mmetsp:Transcript_16159/g.34993  ORF Transcript_16159/g.34993 Transcript_16159/m.34993 type:complete len:122 (-) Transcript_16159:469-834(-)
MPTCVRPCATSASCTASSPPLWHIFTGQHVHSGLLHTTANHLYLPVYLSQCITSSTWLLCNHCNHLLLRQPPATTPVLSVPMCAGHSALGQRLAVRSPSQPDRVLGDLTALSLFPFHCCMI